MVKVRPRGDRWQVDIIFRWPDGARFRERANAPVSSKSAAQRWAEARERTLLAGGREAYEAAKAGAPPLPGPASSKAPTLAAHWPRVLRDHYHANRKKPSTIDAAESIYKNHLATLHATPLDKITTAEVAKLKGVLSTKSKKTVNNVLTVLSRTLRCSVEWGVLPAMPCKIGFFKIADDEMQFYERDEYRRLVEAAKKCSLSVHLLVLLAGSAGLRRGEIRALKWTDIDLRRKQLRVGRALWREHEDTPKGNRGRIVPLTPELAAALKAYQHLKGERVLYSDKGRELSNRTIRNWMYQALRRAGLVDKSERSDRGGPIHVLRHTFCSHLAMAGVPAKAIQELAGHADLATTQRYMHLSPANRSAAMDALAKYHAGSDGSGTAATATG